MDDESARVKNSVAFEDPQKDGDPPDGLLDGQGDESLQNAAQSDDAGRGSG